MEQKKTKKQEDIKENLNMPQSEKFKETRRYENKIASLRFRNGNLVIKRG